jgi:hypothetical protein
MNNENLTFADLQKAYQLLRAIFGMPPTIYYATTKYMERGTAYTVKTGTPDEFYVFHEDEFDWIKRECQMVTFVHIRERPPVDMRPPLKVELCDNCGRMLGASGWCKACQKFNA